MAPTETLDSTIEPEMLHPLQPGSQKRISPRLLRKSDEVRNQVRALYFRGLKLATIEIETGVNRNTIKNWAARNGWVQSVANSQQVIAKHGAKVLIRETNSQLEAASGKLRERFAGILERAGEALDRASIKPTAKSVKAAAEALEPLVRSAKVVHSWGNEGPAGILLTDILGEDREQPPHTEITASVESVPAVADVPATTTPEPAAE